MAARNGRLTLLALVLPAERVEGSGCAAVSRLGALCRAPARAAHHAVQVGVLHARGTRLSDACLEWRQPMLGHHLLKDEPFSLQATQGLWTASGGEHAGTPGTRGRTVMQLSSP